MNNESNIIIAKINELAKYLADEPEELKKELKKIKEFIEEVL